MIMNDIKEKQALLRKARKHYLENYYSHLKNLIEVNTHLYTTWDDSFYDGPYFISNIIIGINSADALEYLFLKQPTKYKKIKFSSHEIHYKNKNNYKFHVTFRITYQMHLYLNITHILKKVGKRGVMP